MATTHPSGRRRILPKDAVLYAPGDLTRNLHRIEEGVVRLCLYLADGQRVIVGFAFPGDVIGLSEDQQVLTAEAATSVMVFEWGIEPREETEQRIKLLSLALHQAYLVLAVRSRRHARARVAAFFLDLTGRGLGTEFRLPLPLADLADHLGLTLHTISRTLTEFRRRGLLRQARGRVFTITQSDRLREIANEGQVFPSESHLPAFSPGMIH
ncbi:MAG: Crp/Fnr family transcriptional regulator [Candidatus Sphingomonas colombiensis]|nr:Crp/Fnr family transcriptional regulator [Sphingomonas sp.]WEK44014.1 MAG: Crp/Fnr family transcriptional regulator [Sphingomonas sp.]